MDRLENILKERKLKGLTWKQLAEDLPIDGNSLRIAFTRKKVDPVYLSHIEEVLKIDKNVQDVQPDVLENKNGNVFFEKEDGSFNVKADIIPFEAYASYLEVLEDATIHHDFDQATFNVDHVGKGNYKAFRIKGESMNGGSLNDTPGGALVLAREVGRHLWKSGFHETKYGFIILSKDNIYHKDIIDFNSDTGDIICHSRNPSREFSDFPINLNDVYQIFHVIKRQF